MDALKSDLSYMTARIPSVPICLEIGCGSGIITTYLAMLRAPHKGIYFATDVNPKAATTARQTMSRNHVKYGDIVLTDLMTAFTPRLLGKVVRGSRFSLMSHISNISIGYTVI
jgi:release factor glutamine methyltransferase